MPIWVWRFRAWDRPRDPVCPKVCPRKRTWGAKMNAERDHGGGCSFVFKATPLAILIRDLVNPAGHTLCEGAEWWDSSQSSMTLRDKWELCYHSCFLLQKPPLSLYYGVSILSSRGYVFLFEFSTLTHPADDVLTDFEKRGRETRWARSEGC